MQKIVLRFLKYKTFLIFQPDGGIRQLSINLLLDSEEPLPVWQVRNQYYWTWDFAQFLIELPVDSKSTKFKLLIIAERGDNDGKVLIRKKKNQTQIFSQAFVLLSYITVLKDIFELGARCLSRGLFQRIEIIVRCVIYKQLVLTSDNSHIFF